MASHDERAAAFNAALEPASAKQIAVALKLIVSWGRLAGLITDENRDEIAEQYKRYLEDIPGDVLVDAVGSVLQRHKYRNLPLPGDFRDACSADLDKRRIAVLLAERDRSRALERIASMEWREKQDALQREREAQERLHAERFERFITDDVRPVLRKLVDAGHLSDEAADLVVSHIQPALDRPMDARVAVLSGVYQMTQQAHWRELYFHRDKIAARRRDEIAAALDAAA